MTIKATGETVTETLPNGDIAFKTPFRATSPTLEFSEHFTMILKLDNTDGIPQIKLEIGKHLHFGSGFEDGVKNKDKLSLMMDRIHRDLATTILHVDAENPFDEPSAMRTLGGLISTANAFAAESSISVYMDLNL